MSDSGIYHGLVSPGCQGETPRSGIDNARKIPIMGNIMDGSTDTYTTLTAMLMGIGLAAACGFRIFVPLLLASLAIRAGVIPIEHIDSSLQWLGSDTAVILFASATLIEVLAYYIPWVDNALDGISTPAAMIAGTIITFAFTPEMSPMLKWGLAIVAGGGTAGILQTGTAAARGGSTLMTGGLANPIVSTIENIGSLLMSVLAIAVPVLCAVVIVFLIIFALRQIFRYLARRRAGVVA